jgi:hypothetical protein
MRLLTTGSRDWEGTHATIRIQILLDTFLAFCEQLGEKLTVVHGDCPTGADRIVDGWARRRDYAGVTVETFPADWTRLGKAAGPRRNQQMVDAGADMCIGFLRANSTGTQHLLAMARNSKIPTFTVHWEQTE